MNTKPLVSIILPTYNRAHILERTIKNMLEQTWRDWELIIVDDCSRDNTEEVVKCFDDLRIRFIKHENNKGEAAARNTGLAHARGALIANQDSDDLWLPQKLKEEVALLSQAPPSVGGVYSQIKRTYLDGSVAYAPPLSFPQTEGNLFLVFLRGDFYITSQAMLVKKECIDALNGFDENLRLLNDADFCIRFAKKYELRYNPHIRVTGDVTPDSQSQNFSKRLEAREYLLKKHEEDLRRHPLILAKRAYNIGNSHALRGNIKRAAPYLRMARAAAPKNLKYRLAFFLSLTGIAPLYHAAAFFSRIREQ